MNPSELAGLIKRADREPRYFARFQVFFASALAFSVFAVIAWGDVLAWVLLGLAPPALALSVCGEIRARRMRGGGEAP